MIGSNSPMKLACYSVLLISSYGAPLAQRASYLAPHTSLFGPDGAVNYDYIVANSVNSLLIGSDVFPMAHTIIIVEPIWPMLQNISKTLLLLYYDKHFITQIPGNITPCIRILPLIILQTCGNTSVSNS